MISKKLFEVKSHLILFLILDDVRYVKETYLTTQHGVY